MQKLSIAVIVLVALTALATATNYCSSSICKGGVKHIACGHNGKFASSCPSDAKMVNIDANLKSGKQFKHCLKSLLVNAHNAKRNLIAGGGVAKYDPACRMATMQWDDELASIAELNVKQCNMAHDKCHNTDAFQFSGQNLFWRTFHTDTPDNVAILTKCVDSWYSEVSDCKMDYINKYPSNYRGPQIGHFTVMMADRNVRVGCAAATYSKPGESYHAYLVACNYATTNMLNFPIYKKCNVPASSCSTGVNPAYPNLCSTSEAYDVNKWF